MNAPSIKECLAMMDQYAMLDNIREHSFVVARVAEAIGTNLDLPGDADCPPPDMNLVLAGALLHDIAKTKCLDGSCQHAEEGMHICNKHGYPEIGRIVMEHVILGSFSRDDYRRGKFGAREIVYYADKRVRHNEIVSLDLRLDYIIDHYSRGSTFIKRRIRDNFTLCKEFETYLFKFLPFSPGKLPAWVEHRPFGAD
jgi:putative nucleotidyltransferase with HDIG domain